MTLVSILSLRKFQGKWDWHCKESKYKVCKSLSFYTITNSLTILNMKLCLELLSIFVKIVGSRFEESFLCLILLPNIIIFAKLLNFQNTLIVQYIFVHLPYTYHRVKQFSTQRFHYIRIEESYKYLSYRGRSHQLSYY